MTFLLLLLCFLLSGFAALLYETAWTRELAVVFGTSELAGVAVLAAYMAGLALGAAAAARLAPRIRRPVLAYAVLELGIALWALAVPTLIDGVQHAYLAALGGLQTLPGTLGPATHAFHLLGSFVVLVPCTALMGATLPLLARHAVTRQEEVGPRIGLLYAVNTLGAIGGTLGAAFVLLPALGLRGTIVAGAVVNGLVFALAAGLARGARAAPSAEARAPARRHWILPAVALSGAVSFGYEVTWFRLLGFLVGGSTSAFSVMLASFLAGIALGSAAASRVARTRSGAAAAFAFAQIGVAVCAWGAFAVADALPGLARQLGASPERLLPGSGLSLLVLLPLTSFVGATFPAAVRLLAADASEAAAASGRVYAWNTLGTIAGAVATGYLLLPWLGFEGTMALGIALNLAIALVAALAGRPRRAALAAWALAGVALLVVLPPRRPEILLRSSPFGGPPLRGELLHLGVGRSATVGLIDVGTSVWLRTNGLPESQIAPPGAPRQLTVAHALAQLPVLARPELRRLLVIGLGGGLTVEAVPSTVSVVEVIELEPEVVAANRAVPARRDGDPLADPRLRIRLGDARAALALSEGRFDAIVSQPSHPWTSGASHLYTREFFALVRERLAPGGVFVQWIGAPFVDLPLLRSLLATLTGVFPHVELYRPSGAPFVMLASDAPLDVVANAPRALRRSPSDFARRGFRGLEDVVAGLQLAAADTRRFAAGAEVVSDDRNALALGRRSRGPGGRAAIDRALAPYDPLPRLAAGLELPRLVRRLRVLGRSDRIERLAAVLPPREAALVRGWHALERHRADEARVRLREARSLGAEEAALPGLALVDDAVDLAALAPRLAAVAHGVRRRGRDWAAVRERDRELARWRPGELLFREAVELRAGWRLAVGSAREAAEALPLVEALLPGDALPRHQLLRARAAVAAGERAAAWGSLEVIGRLPALSGNRRLARQALRLVPEIGAAPPAPAVLARLRALAGAR